MIQWNLKLKPPFSLYSLISPPELCLQIASFLRILFINFYITFALLWVKSSFILDTYLQAVWLAVLPLCATICIVQVRSDSINPTLNNIKVFSFLIFNICHDFADFSERNWNCLGILDFNIFVVKTAISPGQLKIDWTKSSVACMRCHFHRFHIVFIWMIKNAILNMLMR